MIKHLPRLNAHHMRAAMFYGKANTLLRLSSIDSARRCCMPTQKTAPSRPCPDIKQLESYNADTSLLISLTSHKVATALKGAHRIDTTR